jgi:hypothetical protein
MRSFVLDIIVIDPCSAGGFPSKRQVNIALSNQSSLYSVILVLLWYCFGYIIVSLPFLVNYLCFTYYFISGILQIHVQLFYIRATLMETFPLILVSFY